MTTILYNSATSKIIGKYFNGYTVDGKSQPVNPPIYELQYIETIKPVYDSILKTCIETWVPDYILKTWTQTWIISDKLLPTLDQAKTLKLTELKVAIRDLYNTIQWYVEMLRAENTSIPAATLNKIKAIKTRYDAAKATINGYTTVSDVLHYAIPYDQIQTVKDNLEGIF